MPCRQGREKRFIEQYLRRRLEGAKPILVAIEIHTGLDADRCVDVADEGRRYLDMRDAPPIGAGHKRNHVGYYPAADRDNRLVPSIERKRIQFVEKPEIAFGRLVLLTARKCRHLEEDLMAIEVAPDLGAVDSCHVIVHYYEPARVLRFSHGKECRVPGVEHVGTPEDVVFNRSLV